MLKSNQKALQVFINGQWEYLFSRDAESNRIVTTKDRSKAQAGTEEAIAYYQTHRNDLNYRIVKGDTNK